MSGGASARNGGRPPLTAAAARRGGGTPQNLAATEPTAARQILQGSYCKMEALHSMLSGEYTEESTGARTIRQGAGGGGGGKDRHSKVLTARGPRDRRVRLSVPTAIRFYDLQDRLGFEQPSKAVDWLLLHAKSSIDSLPPLLHLHLSHSHLPSFFCNLSSSTSPQFDNDNLDAAQQQHRRHHQTPAAAEQRQILLDDFDYSNNYSASSASTAADSIDSPVRRQKRRKSTATEGGGEGCRQKESARNQLSMDAWPSLEVRKREAEFLYTEAAPPKIGAEIVVPAQKIGAMVHSTTDPNTNTNLQNTNTNPNLQNTNTLITTNPSSSSNPNTNPDENTTIFKHHPSYLPPLGLAAHFTREDYLFSESMIRKQFAPGPLLACDPSFPSTFSSDTYLTDHRPPTIIDHRAPLPPLPPAPPPRIDISIYNHADVINIHPHYLF